MKERRDSNLEWRSNADALREAAACLDAQAEALWLLAADHDRWGLGSDAAEFRRDAIELRVGAVLNRARAAAMEREPADSDDEGL